MSGDMSDTLAEVFGTNKTAAAATPEDLEKRANNEFFMSLCREQNINLEELTDPQVQELYKVAMEMKAAGSDEPEKKDDKGDDDETEKKAEAARQEYAEKRAAAVKVAEAEAMGRIMAHAMVDELNKIAASGGGFPFPPKKDGEKDDGDDKGKKDDKEEGKDKEGSADRAARLIAAFEQSKTAGAAPAAGTSTPNFDEVAAYKAIDLLKEAGVDADTALQRVNAVWVLGLKESTKIASAQSEAEALHARALEICESAGFKVNWS